MLFIKSYFVGNYTIMAVKKCLKVYFFIKNALNITSLKLNNWITNVIIFYNNTPKYSKRIQGRKKELETWIKNSKVKCWRTLCDEVNSDPCGHVHKTVLQRYWRSKDLPVSSERVKRGKSSMGFSRQITSRQNLLRNQ